VVNPESQRPFSTQPLWKSLGNESSRILNHTKSRNHQWLVNTGNTFKDVVSLFSGTWSRWRHTGSHWQVTMLWGNKTLDLDWQLYGCLSSRHPSTLLSSHLSPGLLMTDAQLSSAFPCDVHLA